LKKDIELPKFPYYEKQKDKWFNISIIRNWWKTFNFKSIEFLKARWIKAFKDEIIAENIKNREEEMSYGNFGRQIYCMVTSKNGKKIKTTLQNKVYKWVE
jgi:hypothetical protein